MEKIKLLAFLSMLLCATTFCNAQTKDGLKDSLLISISETLDDIKFQMVFNDRFKLYKTENMYNLLKLDTATGRIEQLQWSLDEKNEGTMIINDDDLTYGIDLNPGVFELYPTNNMYQFILLDKRYGRTWHVQWGLERSKRWIRRIY